ncbi:MAG: GTP 3',8-cyclase MoaA [Thermoprotei archaeon]|nr:MAG: GTP 3',8-cyclase MoaA [Thermoprotei archaeon]
MLKDSYGRIIDHLRISVTRLCNFSCIYCHEEGENYKHRDYELSPVDIEKIVKVAARLGFRKVKITGGEPLIRKDIVEIVNRISRIDGIEDLSLTTNGYLLSDYAEKLGDAGLMRVNVTLPALDREKFKSITGVDGLTEVLDGINAALEAGLKPLKINVPILRRLNDRKEIWNIISYAKRLGVNVQLIEYHSPNPLSSNYFKFHTNFDHIIEKLEKIAVNKVVRPLQARPIYLLDNRVKVEIVKPMFNHNFCRFCRKLRITSDGKIKPCFFRNDDLIDLVQVLNYSSDNLTYEEIERLIRKAVSIKEPYFKSSLLPFLHAKTA